jgi:hypothetical protein
METHKKKKKKGNEWEGKQKIVLPKLGQKAMQELLGERVKTLSGYDYKQLKKRFLRRFHPNDKIVQMALSERSKRIGPMVEMMIAVEDQRNLLKRLAPDDLSPEDIEAEAERWCKTMLRTTIVETFTNRFEGVPMDVLKRLKAGEDIVPEGMVSVETALSYRKQIAHRENYLKTRIREMNRQLEELRNVKTARGVLLHEGWAAPNHNNSNDNNVYYNRNDNNNDHNHINNNNHNNDDHNHNHQDSPPLGGGWHPPPQPTPPASLRQRTTNNDPNYYYAQTEPQAQQHHGNGNFDSVEMARQAPYQGLSSCAEPGGVTPVSTPSQVPITVPDPVTVPAKISPELKRIANHNSDGMKHTAASRPKRERKKTSALTYDVLGGMASSDPVNNHLFRGADEEDDGDDNDDGGGGYGDDDYDNDPDRVLSESGGGLRHPFADHRRGQNAEPPRGRHEADPRDPASEARLRQQHASFAVPTVTPLRELDKPEQPSIHPPDQHPRRLRLLESSDNNTDLELLVPNGIRNHQLPTTDSFHFPDGSRLPPPPEACNNDSPKQPHHRVFVNALCVAGTVMMSFALGNSFFAS